MVTNKTPHRAARLKGGLEVRAARALLQHWASAATSPSTSLHHPESSDTPWCSLTAFN